MAGAGYRSFYMAVRVRDETSRGFQTISRSLNNLGDEGVTFGEKMSGIGSGMMSAGTAAASIGAAGAAVLASMTQSALDFGLGTAYAFTQVDELGVKVDDLKTISRNVAEQVPVPIKEINEGMYDLFSTMDVSAKDAESLMTQLAKATVAGQTDMRTATRGTVAIMNAFDVPAEKMNEVLDFQFQLVRKGAGTYQDFTTSLGLSLPAFAAADQQVDTLGGTLAFLTRNGLSASRASTSAARAMEMMIKPDVIDRLKAMGIEVEKSDGSFQDLGYIMTQLSEGPFKDLAGPEYTEMFKSIFGQGSIQGRRFYDLVLKNTDEYNQRLDEFAEKAGAMEGAYDIMFAEGAIQSELLRNQFDLLKIELGSHLVPAFMKLLEKGFEVIEWFKGLDPELKEAIIKWTAISSAILIAGGSLLFLTGMMILFGVAFQLVWSLMAKRMLFALGPIGILLAMGWLIYDNWDRIGPVFWRVADAVKEFGIKLYNYAIPYIMIAWKWIRKIALIIYDGFIPAMISVWEWALKTWPVVWHWIKEVAGVIEGVFRTAIGYAVTAWDAVTGALTTAYEAVRDVVTVLAGPLVETFHIVVDNVAVAVGLLGDLWGMFVTMGQSMYDTVIKPIYDFIAAIVTSEVVTGLAVTIIQTLIDILVIIGTTLVNIAGELLSFLGDLWGPVWNAIKDVAVAAWDALWIVVQSVLEIALSAINLILSIFTGNWDQAWEEIKDIVGAIWDLIVGAVNLAYDLLVVALDLMIVLLSGIATTIWAVVGDVGGAAVAVGGAVIDGLWDGIQIAAAFLWEKADKVKGWILMIFWNVADWFTNIGKTIIDFIWDSIKLAAESFKDTFAEIGKTIGGWIGQGIKDGIKKLGGWLWGMGSWVWDGIQGARGLIGAQRGMMAYQNGGIVNGPQQALIGEAGAEAVVPLSRPGDAMAILRNSGLDMEGMGGQGVTVNIYGNVNDAEEFANKVALAIGEEMFANGY